MNPDNQPTEPPVPTGAESKLLNFMVYDRNETNWNPFVVALRAHVATARAKDRKRIAELEAATKDQEITNTLLVEENQKLRARIVKAGIIV